MSADDFLEELHQQRVVAETNQRYHQLQHHKWWRRDKAVKIAVAFLAILALLAAFLPHEWKWLEVACATLAAMAAVVLNVVPVGEWVTEYGEMFRSWSDLVLTAEQLAAKARYPEDDGTVPDALVERLEELASRSLQLDAMEGAADEALLARCQGDVIERMYGEGVRTYEQAMARHEEAAHHA